MRPTRISGCPMTWLATPGHVLTIVRTHLSREQDGWHLDAPVQGVRQRLPDAAPSPVKRSRDC